MLNNMEEQFVTPEIALKLKEKGFLHDCFGFYYYDGSFQKYRLVYEESSDGWHNPINAPLWQQVIDWFENNHQIDIHVEVERTEIPALKDSILKAYQIRIITQDKNTSKYITQLAKNKYEANVLAINQALALI